MAEKDLKTYFDYKKLGEDAISELKLLREKCNNNKVLNRSVGFKISQSIKDIESEIKKLEKYSLCEHEKTKEGYVGSDSHKDHYHEVCIKCGKEIRDWSI